MMKHVFQVPALRLRFADEDGQSGTPRAEVLTVLHKFESMVRSQNIRNGEPLG